VQAHADPDAPVPVDLDRGAYPEHLARAVQRGGRVRLVRQRRAEDGDVQVADGLDLVALRRKPGLGHAIAIAE
jgi:hypothetical protein